MTNHGEKQVAIVGAGPAGLYAARALAAAGVRVVLLNRDCKPGGLAEYGIYPDKHKMKEGLRAQFRQILDSPLVQYYGHVRIGEGGDLAVSALQQMGFDAVLVAVGAQGTKWLGLPGEQFEGVYHAKDLVYHYNLLPPFSERSFLIRQRAAVVGAGNVMMDIARYLVHECKIEEVVVVVRRGPAEVKFDKREFEVVAANVDLPSLDAEMARVTPFMQAIGQDPVSAKADILAGLPRALARDSDTRVRFQFLTSPVEILGDAQNRVSGLRVEDNCLAVRDGEVKARGLGTRRVLDVDTVVFAIGDRVEDKLGLPIQGGGFAANPNPRFPVDGVSYEAFDAIARAPIEGVFLAGWARVASTGLVGVARKDGERGARAVLQYLSTLSAGEKDGGEALPAYLQKRGASFVTKEDIRRLEKIEQARAQQLGFLEWKSGSNEEMLTLCGRGMAGAVS